MIEKNATTLVEVTNQIQNSEALAVTGLVVGDDLLMLVISLELLDAAA